MINFKALLAGIALIIFFGLLLQLIFILAATGYTVLIKDHPELQTIGLIVSYILGAVGYFFIMSSSAYITAYIAEKNIYLHASLIALLTTGISLISSVREDNFTLTSFLFVIAGIIFSNVGAFIWQQHQQVETPA